MTALSPAAAAPRIVSLVPNGTEILFALGAGSQVVGVSHECDFPPEARELPILTGSALAPDLAPAEIDRAVSAQVGQALSLYTIDDALLARLGPDLIVTQELCPVCAVSTDQVEGAVAPLPRCPDVLSLDPRRLADVFEDIRSVGAKIGREREAAALVESLEARLGRLKESRAASISKPPRVLALEWLEPPFAGGHWVPEMIEAAGGIDVVARPGDGSRRMTWAEVAALDPDLIVAMPCGFDEAGAHAQVARIASSPEWMALRAVREGRVFPVDANGCFSRPGPRLVDGIERLAEIFRA